MSLMFDASAYFTRAQADHRYVRSPLTADEITGILRNGVGTLDPGTQGIPGVLLVPLSVTGSQIAQGAVDMLKLSGDLGMVQIVPAGDPQPTPVKEGAQIFWDGQLYTCKKHDDGTFYWDNSIPSVNITGQMTAAQIADEAISAAKFAQNIRPNVVVNSIPTIQGNPPNYKPGDVITLAVSGQAPVLYQLDTNSQWQQVLDPTVSQVLSTRALYADWLTAGEISVGAVKASQIDVTDLRSTGLIGANQLTANNINVNNLVANLIGVNALTAVNLAAGSVTADQLAVNAVTAGKIAAGAIATSNLVAGSFTSMLEDGMFTQSTALTPTQTTPSGSAPWVQDGGGIGVSAGSSSDGSQTAISARGTTYAAVRKWAAGGAYTAFLKNRMVFDVKPAGSPGADTVFVEGWAWNHGANGNALLRVAFFKDQACTQQVSTYDIVWPASSCVDTWYYQSVATPIVVPATAYWAQIQIVITAQSQGTWVVDNVFAIKATPSAYISSLSATVITSGILNCNSITVQNLRADAITSGTLNCTSITVQNINGVNAFQPGTLPGGAIQNLSITNAQIADATIASAKIDSLTATKINSGVLTLGGPQNGAAASSFQVLDSLSALSCWSGMRVRSPGVPLRTSPSGIVLMAGRGGSNYTSAPTVFFSGGGGGSGAAATALISGGRVTGFTLISAGDHYTTAPEVTIIGGGGSGAMAYAVLQTTGNYPGTSNPVQVDYGFWGKNVWIGGTDPSSAVIAASSSGVVINGATISLDSNGLNTAVNNARVMSYGFNSYVSFLSSLSGVGSDNDWPTCIAPALFSIFTKTGNTGLERNPVRIWADQTNGGVIQLSESAIPGGAGFTQMEPGLLTLGAGINTAAIQLQAAGSNYSQLLIDGTQVVTARQAGPGTPSGFADSTAQTWCNNLLRALQLHGLVT